MTGTTPFAAPDPAETMLARCMDVLRRHQPAATESVLATTALALTRRHVTRARMPEPAGNGSTQTLLAVQHSIDRVLGQQALRRRLADAFGAPAAAARRRCVLLVDDATDVLVTLGAFLEGAGFEVLKASSGDAALRLLAVTPGIDAMVTDVAMPGMSGVELVHQALEQQPDLPTVVVTAYADPKLLESLPEQTRILRKPFRCADLVRCVKDIAPAHEAMRA